MEEKGKHPWPLLVGAHAGVRSFADISTASSSPQNNQEAYNLYPGLQRSLAAKVIFQCVLLRSRWLR